GSAQHVVGGQHVVGHIGVREYLDLAELLTGDADRARVDLHAADRRNLVRLDVRPVADAMTSEKRLHTPDVRFHHVEADRDDRRVEIGDGGHAQSRMTPPSTVNDWPVTFPAPGDARNTASAATSSGSLGRPSGIAAFRRRFISSTLTPSARARASTLASESALVVVPGQIALTLMPWAASCSAAMRVRLMTAP